MNAWDQRLNRRVVTPGKGTLRMTLSQLLLSCRVLLDNFYQLHLGFTNNEKETEPTLAVYTCVI